MRRHPGRTTIVLDVDALVLGPLGPLAAIDADVAMHFVVKRKSSGNHALFARSGTMVFQPTPLAAAFVRNWCGASERAPKSWVDQSTLLEAISRTPGLTVEQLDVRYCATRKDAVTDPIVLHDQGSGGARKMRPWQRSLIGVVDRLGIGRHMGVEGNH